MSLSEMGPQLKLLLPNVCGSDIIFRFHPAENSTIKRNNNRHASHFVEVVRPAVDIVTIELETPPAFDR